MNVALTDHFERFIRGKVKSGRYNNSSEVVRDALRKLEAEETSPEVIPPGALAALYTAQYNREDRRLARASALHVEGGD